MIGVKELLVLASNTPCDTPVRVDVAGNGKDLLTVNAIEVRNGTLVIDCFRPKPDPAPVPALKGKAAKAAKAAAVEAEKATPAPAETAEPVAADAPAPEGTTLE